MAASSGKHETKSAGNNKLKLVNKVTTRTLSSSEKKQTKGKKSKRYLEALFEHEWTLPPSHLQNAILSAVTNFIMNANLKKPSFLQNRGGKKVKMKRQALAVTTDIMSIPNLSTEDGENQKRWQCFHFGVNAVTRATEKGATSLVLVDSSVEPKLLTKHLAELTQVKGVPAACLSGLSEAFFVTGLPSFSCLAVRPLDEVTSSDVSEMVQKVLALIPKHAVSCNRYDVPKLDLSQDSQEGISLVDKPESSEEELPPPTVHSKYRLPAEDVTFSSLYVMKNDLVFSNEESFIALPKIYDDSGPEAKKPRTSAPIRYMAAKINVMKNNPNRKEDKKVSKEQQRKPGQLPMFLKRKSKPN